MSSMLIHEQEYTLADIKKHSEERECINETATGASSVVIGGAAPILSKSRIII
jgi:hypothetical protein